MRKDRLLAYKLRMQGKSYTEIARSLSIAKSTLSSWFANIELPNEARERLKKRVQKKSTDILIRRNILQTHKAQQNASHLRTSGRSEITQLSPENLKLIGIALYWAEGYKRPIIRDGKTKTYHPVSLTNSDPFLVKVFLRFLREICLVPEEKIHAGLRIYEHQNEGHLLEFWSRTTRISPNNFEKFYYGVSKSSQGKRPYNILPYGTIQIRVNNTNLYHKIMGWIEGLGNI